MQSVHNINDSNPAHDSDVTSARVDKAYWFIAKTPRYNIEKMAAARLTELGYECYVATQEEYRVWKSGKRVKLERVVIPSVVFIRCTERERRQIVQLPFISRFMVNGANSTEGLHRPLAVVSDHEINQLKFMLGASNSPVSFTQQLVKGRRVRVMRGILKGLEGRIVREPGGNLHRLYINIEFLGTASVEISAYDVEPII